jgi:DHA2 family multidrug resistance protein-like MFS transporter
LSSTTAAATANTHQSSNRLILGIVLAVITFWLFAQTTLNVAPTMREELRISESLNNIAVSITALFSGIFIVVAGSLADRLGRLKITYFGLALSVLGSLLIAISPAGTFAFLMTGRVIQGLSAACIMPATLALIKDYFDGKQRQRALSFWSIGSWGGSGVSALFGGLVASSLGWRWIFRMSIVVAAVSFVLLRGAPESKVTSGENAGFDLYGFTSFIVSMVAVNIVIGQGSALGWLNPVVITLAAIFVVAAVVFFRVESRNPDGFVDLTLFNNKTYAGAALSNVPNEKAGAASGIYKMASSLGAAFGVAISAALFTSLSGLSTSFAPLSDLFLGRTDNVGIRFAAAVALLFNVIMVIVAIIAIAATVPNDDPRVRVTP